MPKTLGRRIVVDANVARSAGLITEVPASTYSRLALLAILDRRHRIVMTNNMRAEWEKHESRFASGWRVRMQQRGLILRVEESEFASLGRRLNSLPNESINQQALVKDFHVFASALAADRVIVSNDIQLKKNLATLASFELLVGKIIWGSPEQEGNACVVWLQMGAKDESNRYIALAVS